MLEELDAIIPEYRAAREAYSGPSHSIEMVERGRDYWRAKGDPADAIREFEGLPPADKDYVRIGIVRDALKDIGNTTDTGSIYVRLFSTPNRRALLQKVFPDQESFERFAKQMQAEKQMLSANRMIMSGSPTSRIDADKAERPVRGIELMPRGGRRPGADASQARGSGARMPAIYGTGCYRPARPRWSCWPPTCWPHRRRRTSWTHCVHRSI